MAALNEQGWNSSHPFVAMRTRFEANSDLNEVIVRAVVLRESLVGFRSAQPDWLDHDPPELDAF